jgi:hypothetical protein
VSRGNDYVFLRDFVAACRRYIRVRSSLPPCFMLGRKTAKKIRIRDMTRFLFTTRRCMHASVVPDGCEEVQHRQRATAGLPPVAEAAPAEADGHPGLL